MGLTKLKGNQHIYVTVKRHQNGTRDLYMNNARILTTDASAVSEEDESQQVLHIIDDVLMPTIPDVKDNSLYNPSALELISNSGKYKLHDKTLQQFADKVAQLDKTGVFDTDGHHTYFIPVDDGFSAVRDRVDGPVVDAHFIPNKVLFTRTLGNQSHLTGAFEDPIKVTVRLRQQGDSSGDSGDILDLQSNTLLGDSVHLPGTVLTQIIQPNIAVKNGVVHLISRPLVVMGSTSIQFIEDSRQARFLEFYSLVEQHAPDFLDTLREAANSTVFIPSNEAFYTVDQDRLNEVKASPEKLRNLLNLHLVRQRVTTKDVREKLQTSSEGQGDLSPKLYNVSSADPGRSLYLHVSGVPGHNQTLTVEGGGTNATVTVADIVTDDGVIHVIDKLLGVPYRSLGDKLAVDAMMLATSALATQDGFADDIRRMDKQFTMFVPSDSAWKEARRQWVTSVKYLFEGSAEYQSTRILQRHLIIGQASTIDELARITRKDGFVKTFRSKFRVERIPGTSDYTVKWEGLEARVIRTNVECTNGFIHVIDGVMMRQRDVNTSGGATVASSAVCLLAALALLRL